MATSSLRLGPYELLRRIKAGGMAEIYLASDADERHVAVKRLLPAAAEDTELVAMFHAEAALMAMLDHPRIPTLVAPLSDDGGRSAPFVVYEFLDGVDLATLRRALISRGEQPSSDIVAAVGWQAANALDYVHGCAMGIVHRDVSPHNIMVLRSGRLMLIDFGIAKFDGNPCETQAGVLKGKHAYMSPEQIGERPVDGRSDVFALGATLYELASCTRLFKAPTPIESLRLIEQAIVPDLAERAPELSPELCSTIHRCLQRNPQDRPNATELAETLRELSTTHGERTLSRLLERVYGTPDPKTGFQTLREYRDALRSAEMNGVETTDQIGHSNATMVTARPTR